MRRGELPFHLRCVVCNILSREEGTMLSIANANGVDEDVVFENAAHDNIVVSDDAGVALLLHLDQNAIQVIILVLITVVLRTIQDSFVLVVHHDARALVSIWKCAKRVFDFGGSYCS